MSLRIGIIGAGQVGERHAAGFAMTPGVTITGIADVVAERAAALARRHRAQAHTDWRRMLESGLDVLVVGLPHDLHVEPACASAARGIHVLMEKPIAIKSDDAWRIVDACTQANVKLTVSFVHRYREELQLVRRWLSEGRLGAVQLARETMNGQTGDHLPAWVASKTRAGGGVMMYSAIHSIDRLRWLLDSEVVHVMAHSRVYDSVAEVEQGVAAVLRFANGAVATLTASAPTYCAQPTFWETEIFGTMGMARLRTREWAELSAGEVQLRENTAGLAAELGPHYNFARQATAFVAAIQADEEPPVSGIDGIRALDAVMAIYRSAECGEPVELEQGIS